MSSTISLKYPSFRKDIIQTGHSWLDGKRKDDRAENLWRVHDDLYDLTAFVDKHPGGPDWLSQTKGTDITELFESHHISSSAAELILKKYKVREAKEPRNYKFTFSENGFYRTLKRRVNEKLKTLDRSVEIRSKIIADSLFFVSLLLAIAAVKFTCKWLVLPAGLSLTWTIISAHNFFHRRDNWRMYYFNLAGMSYKDWRISHAMSHHVYTNSYHDLEMSYFEPFLSWIPTKKTVVQKYGSWIYGPVIYLILFSIEFTKRATAKLVSGTNRLGWDDLLPLVVPITMYLCTSAPLLLILKYWTLIFFSASFCFTLIGLNAAHHHPDITHEGDAVSLDWGIYQLDTVMDREDIKGSQFLVLTHFGEHALHHLFPTLDHALLPQLHGVFYETLEEFEFEVKGCSWFEHIIGQHRQLSRENANATARREKRK